MLTRNYELLIEIWFDGRPGKDHGAFKSEMSMFN